MVDLFLGRGCESKSSLDAAIDSPSVVINIAAAEIEFNIAVAVGAVVAYFFLVIKSFGQTGNIRQLLQLSCSRSYSFYVCCSFCTLGFVVTAVAPSLSHGCNVAMFFIFSSLYFTLFTPLDCFLYFRSMYL